MIYGKAGSEAEERRSRSEAKEDKEVQSAGLLVEMDSDDPGWALRPSVAAASLNQQSALVGFVVFYFLFFIFILYFHSSPLTGVCFCIKIKLRKTVGSMSFSSRYYQVCF